MNDQAAERWHDALLAAALFALNPPAFGGVVLRSLPGPYRDAWLDYLDRCLPQEAPRRHIPLNISDDRLLGGLDLAATLEAGRPVVMRGVLAEADGGVVYLHMAERMKAGVAARLSGVLDRGEVQLERDGLTASDSARLGVVALDEGLEPEEKIAPGLGDRLAFHLDLNDLPYRLSGGLSGRLPPDDPVAPDQVAAAGQRITAVTIDDESIADLCGTALALGIASLRGSLLAVQAARAAAALRGASSVADEDVLLAARLVLAPRATRLPAAVEQAPEEEDMTEQADAPPPETPDVGNQAQTAPEQESQAQNPEDQPEADTMEIPEDLVLAAAAAAIPPNLLADLQLAAIKGQGRRPDATGRAGAATRASGRGRPIGCRPGLPGNGQRLNLVATLKSAAPWQRLRGGGVAGGGGAGRGRLQVRSEDFRITRYQHRRQTTTIFVVDASGSAALQRLAEAKGAVELLLADCYVRRDRVAMVAFRGRGADILLPPTRSLVRAKRRLAGLPGGGGTPLAAGLDRARELALSVLREGGTPVVVVLTDGRANVSRAGVGDRAVATEEAAGAARVLADCGCTNLVVDTAPRPRDSTRELASMMSARYLPLPHAGAAALSAVVREAGS